jgi:hypothetical protein
MLLNIENFILVLIDENDGAGLRSVLCEVSVYAIRQMR